MSLEQACMSMAELFFPEFDRFHLGISDSEYGFIDNYRFSLFCVFSIPTYQETQVCLTACHLIVHRKIIGWSKSIYPSCDQGDPKYPASIVQV